VRSGLVSRRERSTILIVQETRISSRGICGRIVTFSLQRNTYFFRRCDAFARTHARRKTMKRGYFIDDSFKLVPFEAFTKI